MTEIDAIIPEKTKQEEISPPPPSPGGVSPTPHPEVVPGTPTPGVEKVFTGSEAKKKNPKKVLAGKLGAAARKKKKDNDVVVVNHHKDYLTPLLVMGGLVVGGLWYNYRPETNETALEEKTFISKKLNPHIMK